MTSVNHGTTVCGQTDSHKSVTVVKVPSLSVTSAVIQSSMVTTVTVTSWTTMLLTVRLLTSSTRVVVVISPRLMEEQYQMEDGTTMQPLSLVLFALTTKASPTTTLHFVTVGILQTPAGSLASVITVCTVIQKPKLPRTGSPPKRYDSLTVQTMTLVLTYFNVIKQTQGV